MKLIPVAIVLGLLGASSVADANTYYTTSWQFTATTNSVVEDYSTNLEEELATTLPHDLINEGWACTRKPLTFGYHMVGRMRTSKDAVIGSFVCTNGTEQHTVAARCSLTDNDKGHAWMSLSLDKETLTFDISCQSVR